MTRRVYNVFERFTERARTVLDLAARNAAHERAPELRPIDLLAGCLAEGEGLAYRALVTCGVTERPIIDASFVPEGLQKDMDARPYGDPAKAVLEAALREALALGHNYIGTEHVLLALCSRLDGEAVEGTVLDEALSAALFNSGTDSGELRDEVLRQLRGPRFASPANPEANGSGDEISPGEPVAQPSDSEPARRACPVCKGVGLNPRDPYALCPKCDGETELPVG